MTAALSLAMTFGPARSASAQYLRFRVTDSYELNFVPNADIHGTMGINSDGIIVYAYEIDDELHACAWLPQPLFNLSQGFYDLNDQSGSSDDSIARDINDDGRITGASNGILGESSMRSTVWTLASTITYTTLSGGRSSAHGINSDSSPLVVGWRDVTQTCDCRLRNSSSLFLKVEFPHQTRRKSSRTCRVCEA